MLRIAVCAPSAPFDRADAGRVAALVADYAGLDIHFHEQCFAQSGHFAGTDQQRRDAFVECANDPGFDAVWFARGGYGAGRIAQDAIGLLAPAAQNKAYLGYSDGGVMLAALYRAKVGRSVHAPMPADVRRDGGEAAVRRVLAWLQGDSAGLEPTIPAAEPVAAFNLMTLSMIMGTPVMPDLAGHVVMVEEVSEYDYAVDRLLFHVSAGLAAMKVAGLRLGRVTQVPENDKPFGIGVEDMARHWCARTGLPYLGRADIGHDGDNRIVPFGLAGTPPGQ
ncbi:MULTISPECIES: LD-carboxypeptidase [unclassified Novosphingobium]|uniref:LD-carboxypeptidase n=1 Tax=unclassified Novosphingobium TaxID=2644732 RepID=UPI000D31FC6E|nr:MULTISPECIES: LD-carboxypeptidase [unclassified Novosphingobium]PTR11106.1 muramoyltetrapeptide carboxypeptidase [Novosphingobium sp. GV055]PUB03656.1 muramoyltetrapeptide carboxypeptidase [Novosphingobium sp. GV061]PUB20111.1 muramoyltetrapeptide carboxypeptidase [Novosphingobium sp. GV079]PUB41872.1 muramoyltetrapeptide carboxypeptidase [Novosphingobium sp. GV027]